MNDKTKKSQKADITEEILRAASEHLEHSGKEGAFRSLLSFLDPALPTCRTTSPALRTTS